MKRLRILASVSAAFADATANPMRLVQTIVDVFTEQVADACAILTLDEGASTLRPGAFAHRSPELKARVEAMLADQPLRLGEGLLGTAAQTLEPRLIPHIEQTRLVGTVQDGYRELVEQNPAHTLLVVPMELRGRCLGVLAMARDRTPEPFDEDDLRLAQDIADRAAMALELSHLLQRERFERERAAALAETSKEIQTLDLDDALRRLVRLGAALVGDACVVTLLEGDAPRAVVAAHRDPELDVCAQRVVGTTVTDPHSMVLIALRENRAVRIGDARDYRSSMAEGETYRRDRGIVSLLACPLRVRGEVIGTVGVSRDAGGRFYTEADEHFLQDLADRAAHVIHNARLYREARHANELKDAFLAVASHELRTPIGSLWLTIQATLTQVAAGTMSLDQVRPRLERAESHVKRLAALVERMLDASRIHAGRLELVDEDTDLVGLTRAVAQRFDEASDAGGPIAIDSPPTLVGRWDREWLDQVITNLISNAVKYGEGKPIELQVVDHGATAELCVVDHGMGIATENQERIFERFERAVPTRNYPGFGIGLWLVREVVTAMGGTIRVESRPGNGATFVVSLPKA